MVLVFVLENGVTFLEYKLKPTQLSSFHSICTLFFTDFEIILVRGKPCSKLTIQDIRLNQGLVNKIF